MRSDRGRIEDQEVCLGGDEDKLCPHCCWVNTEDFIELLEPYHFNLIAIRQGALEALYDTLSGAESKCLARAPGHDPYNAISLESEELRCFRQLARHTWGQRGKIAHVNSNSLAGRCNKTNVCSRGSRNQCSDIRR